MQTVKPRYRPDLKRWEVRPIIDGKRKSIYGQSEEEVLEKVQILQSASKSYNSTPTLSDFAYNSYLPTVAHRSEKWQEQIVWAYGHIMPKLGNTPIDEIDRPCIQRFLEGLQNSKTNRPLGRTSKGHVKTVIGAILELAIGDEIITRNPVRFVKLPTERKVKAIPYSPEEIARIINASEGKVCRNGIILSAFLGLRVNECIGLKWSDLSKGMLSVQRQGPNGSPLKTLSSHRSFPAPDGLADLLDGPRFGYVSKVRSDRNLVGWPTDTTKTYKKRGSYLVGRGYREAVRLAGVRDLPFHSLRKSAATGLEREGCPQGLISAILGHSSGNVTRLYIHDDHEVMAIYLNRWFKRLHACGVMSGVKIAIAGE